jgi:hypothetical protein
MIITLLTPYIQLRKNRKSVQIKKSSHFADSAAICSVIEQLDKAITLGSAVKH